MQSKRRLSILFMAAIAVSLIAAANASAVEITFEHRNSTATVDTDGQFGPVGMNEWTVDGRDYLFQQWFWYRVNGDDFETSFDNLRLENTLVTEGLSATTLEMEYLGFVGGDENAPFEIFLTYSLIGGTDGSGTADLGEQITINNFSGGALDFHLFQYADFDLCGIFGDTVSITGGNTARQSDEGCILSETVVTPPPSHFEVNAFANTRNSLEDGNPTTLNDDAGPFTGDATWAFQWDRTIANNGTLIISKNKHLETPEPGLLLLLGLGLAATGFLRRKQ